MPVGEIGKMLQDSTGITTLSTSLKLKFGGLKKFLEKYPDDFVIGVNHPFNPHVYLKETLSAEDVHAISKGEIPKSVLIKFKKVQKEIVRRKKAGLAVAGTTSGEHTTPISGMTTNLLQATAVHNPFQFHPRSRKLLAERVSSVPRTLRCYSSRLPINFDIF